MLKRILRRLQMAAPLCVRAHTECGQSLVEFAMVLPLVLLVVTGILSFGAVVYQNIALSQATQVALRQLVVSRGQTTDPCATVNNAIVNSASNLNRSTMTITTTLNGTSYTGTTCSSMSANMILGAGAQVKTTLQTQLLPFNDPISTSFQLSAQSQDKIQ